MSLRLFSPAKINLYLRLVGKREDGYHNLESLFQAISLKDEIFFSLSSKDTFTCDDPNLPLDHRNFIQLALNSFRQMTKIKTPVSIHLNKKIPIQAGLGGGSSNGATTLWGLNKLLKANLSKEQLLQLAAQVSSDSPFFFSKGSALCEGRGDIVKDLKSLNSQTGWLVKPDYGISTHEAFKRTVHIDKPKVTIEESLKSFYGLELKPYNQLEEIACLIEPRLKKLKDKLCEDHKRVVFMTGSGSALVCFGKKPTELENTVQIYPFHYINRGDAEWYSDAEE